MRWIRTLGVNLGLTTAFMAPAAMAQQTFINVLTGGQSGVC